MKTKKPLWMNQPDADATSIRFSCPYCHTWVRKQEFEQHVEELHHAERASKLNLAQAANR